MARGLKSLQASRTLSPVIKEYYKNAHQAKKDGKPIAWMTGLAPVELFYALDIFPIMPENFAAACAAYQMGTQLIENAEAKHYSPDICSYARIHLGSYDLKDEDLPFGGLPEPNFLLVSKTSCVVHLKWWEILARKYNKPLFVWDIPYVQEELDDKMIQYGVGQLKELIAALEKLTGKKMDQNRLREIMTISDQAAKMWYEIHEERKRVPTPVGGADIFSSLFAIVTLPGTQECNDYLSRVLAEVREKAARLEGIVNPEKYRLIWDNLPIWFNMGILEKFSQRNAAFVAETYNVQFWGKRMDPDHPLESLVKKHFDSWLNKGIELKVKEAIKMAKDYMADGFVLHSNVSCRPYSMVQPEIAKALKRELGIPSYSLIADHGDPRQLNEDKVDQELDVFFEILESKKY